MNAPANNLRVAIIGSGPAGFYAADRLRKKGPNVSVDMFDLLPTPHGLVRHGVAPDHQKIKSVAAVYDRIAADPDFRFFGFVEFGTDITLDDLACRYHQIVFATGAQTDKKIDIPGTDLPGSHTATEFVAWYNGHPYKAGLDFDMSGGRAVIIGIGNVAVDVARILCLSSGELAKTDMADYAVWKLSRSDIREVIMVGRRGPAQAAFTNPELKELGNLTEASVAVRPEDLELDGETARFLEENPNAATVKKLEILKNLSQSADGVDTADKMDTKPPSHGEPPDGKKKLHIRFLLSPVSIDAGADGRVSSVTFEKNKLVRREDGGIAAVPSGGTETITAGIVFRSVGYRGVALKGVPFDEKAGIIPNDSGRVLDKPGGRTVNGLYTAGWIKRGATGVIGTNKTDSAETVDKMLEDFAAGVHLRPDKPDEFITKLLERRKPEHVSYREWKRIDEEEKQTGKSRGRPRVKYTSVEEILKSLGKK